MKSMATKAAPQKTLFVGKARICQQIAYVLDIKESAQTEQLTAQNWEQYHDYQIYVCEFKRKSRQCVELKTKTLAQLKLQYLDDIGRTIDAAYDANRKRREPNKRALEASQSPSLWQRIQRGMKHPLRAAWHLMLRIKYRMKRYRSVVRRRRMQSNYVKQVRRGKLEYLPRLKPSELLAYVLQAKPNPNIQCTLLETNLRVVENGNLNGCCSVVVPFGNLLHDGELAEIYHSTYARIVKLSSLNRSYCLCNMNTWCKGYCSAGESASTAQWQTPLAPEAISLTFDKSCNLCCRQCRAKPYVMDQAAQQAANTVVAKLLRSGWLDQVKILKLAGSGEVFYSPYYRRLLTTEIQRKEIKILSNGTLFNADNWRLLAGKYTTIDVHISVDAATAETYQKLRGADFENLMQNMNMLADLHRQKKIRKFYLNFVVQRDNFREMSAFVRLGQELGVDQINFQRLNHVGSFADQKFLERCLIIDNQYLDYDLWCVLQDPIFRDPIVDLRGLQRYLDASECRYRQRYEKEQKQRRSV